MPDNTPPTAIDYYTDLLCVWAWISQPRLDELQRQWHHQIVIRHRYLDIFGDSHFKIKQRWGQEDGFEKFAVHVSEAAAPYENTPIHPDIWRRVRPRSSLPAHLLLKAVAELAGDEVTQTLALQIRRAFFLDGQDISQLGLLLELAEDQSLDTGPLQQILTDGRAMAGLSRDQQGARELGVKVSPAWVLNEGRQILYGNVGYRILHANIEELLKHPGTEASWC